MRLAVISDIHGDVHALTDALRHIDAMGCDAVVCAGDVIDWGLFHDETVALLRRRRIPTIRGNHDRWAVGHGQAGERREDCGGDEPYDAGGLDLSSESVRWLAKLPTSWRTTVEGVRVAVHHGTPTSDLDGIYPDRITANQGKRWLDEAGADVLIVGHTHIPFAIEIVGCGWIVNPGALLRSPAHPIADPVLLGSGGKRVNLSPGLFGVLELPSRSFSVFTAVNGAPAEIMRRRFLWCPPGAPEPECDEEASPVRCAPQPNSR